MSPASSSSSFEPSVRHSGMLRVAARFARRELRGGLKGFRVFLACLALGVAAIAGVGSLSAGIQEGLRADAKILLGGDVDLRLTHKPANPEQREWLEENSARVSEIVQMRAMAIRPDGAARRLVEMKAVDDDYPIYGDVALSDGTALSDHLDLKDGVWGAVAAPQLFERLELDVGDRISVGEATFELRGIVAEEPDKGTQAFNLGPRLFIAEAALEETELVQPGSLVRYHYRVAVNPADGAASVSVDGWIDAVKERFPDAGWRIRSLDNAAPNIQRFIDRVELFLTLVGLTALLVGGVGVSNAVRAFLNARAPTIATLKCLGASQRIVFATYLIQVSVLALAGIVVGAAVGAGAPLLAAPLLEGRLPIEARFGIYPEPLLLSVVFGLLVTLVFTLWPLARAGRIPAANLFRDAVSSVSARPGWRVISVIGILGLALAGLAVVSSAEKTLAISFVGGAVVTLVAFRGAAWAVMAVSSRMPRPKGIRLGLAMANLHRPGAPTGSVVVSLGLGLTVLVAVALIEGNLSRQVGQTFRDEAPGYYFIDIQPDQIDSFQKLVADFGGVERSDSVPMLRGRLVSLDGISVDEIEAPSEFAWILRGDRGITWSLTPPREGSEVVEGDWWQQDQTGKQLVSFDVEAARAFGLEIGDTLTVNVLGREIQAEIANLRRIEWTSLGINFVMIFSPGVMQNAPQSYIATAYLPADRETALEAAVTDRFPNVSAIRVKEVLEGVNEILRNLGVAVRAIASVAIAAGILVLAGAIAAGHSRRIYDAVVLKVLGATRRDVITAFLIEYGLLGLVTAAISSVVGTVAAYLVIVEIMQAEWVFIPSAIGYTVVLALGVTLALGLIGTWNALGRQAAPLLRNE